MKMKMFMSVLVFTLVAGNYCFANGRTEVMKWKNGKKAAFLMMFDDGLPSHVNNVIPELEKRGLIGTFYLNPAKYNYKKYQDDWEAKIPKKGMSYGNHTMTHKGVKDFSDADKEIGECSEILLRINPPSQTSSLMSFAMPGVKKGKWNISKQELETLLKKHNLVCRPTFSKHGAAVHCKTAKQMIALVDKAIKNNSCEYLIFHGVGGEYLKVSLKVFTAFIEQLKEREKDLWITSHIDCHKYETERDNASIKVIKSNENIIKLNLTSKVDKKLYEYPLTLKTNVPKKWKKVMIVQGNQKVIKPVVNGIVKYDVVPNGGIISLTAKK